jgi:pyruvate-formate lyase-activating enzyme
VRVDPGELIPLPFGSVLFSLPGRSPVFFDRESGALAEVPYSPDGGEALGASAFLSSGYLRTYLPAYKRKDGAPLLPLWAYTGLVIRGDEFLVPALRVDDDPRSDPEIHCNDRELAKAVKRLSAEYGANRLVGQLARCATQYNCLCARNFFLGRYEVPVPTTPPCNARCLGCLSHQEGSGFCGSQERLGFMPAPDEIAEVILRHFSGVDAAVSSFGQGCEGEPLLRGKDLAKAIGIVRGKTERGTININTNGSLPEMVKLLIDAGLDSIRISLNSPTRAYYERYYRMQGYSFDDVLRSLELALGAGIFVSINLFFLPGFTDMESEAEALFDFLGRFPVSMIQARNLNIDPDYYLENIGFTESPPLGVRNLLKMIREKHPGIMTGYYNPPRERFAKP